MQPSTPAEQRARKIKALQEGVYDAVIIGGGINGAAVARDAALRGLRVAMLEQNDLAFGTSSRSSRLIHGGLRYLELGELGLVFEAVNERALLSRVARHIARPLPFIVPVYDGDTFPLFLVDVGLWIYDGLALFRNYQTHRKLDAEALLRQLPGARSEGLHGGVHYYDYQTNDARLVLENALGAERARADLLTYCRVEELLYSHGKVAGVRARDRLSGVELTLKTRVVVSAAGPWTDEVLAKSDRPERWLRPSKGVHIVVPREKLATDEALVLRHPKDNRVLFILPYHERTVIGTTDTDFEGDPADLWATRDDVEYLVAAAKYQFPHCPLRAEDTISNWAGIRPLLAQQDADNPSAVSREHRIHARSDGLVVVAGGKLTTYRSMADECVGKMLPLIEEAGGNLPQRGCETDKTPLPGAKGLRSDDDLWALCEHIGSAFGETPDQISREEHIPCNAIGRHLGMTYGIRSHEVATIAQDMGLNGEDARVDPELPFSWAEFVYAARAEMAMSLEDAMIRRSHIFFRGASQGLPYAERAAELMGKELGWSGAEQQAQVEHYERVVAKSRAWRDEG